MLFRSGVLAVADLGAPPLLVVGGRRVQPVDQGGAFARAVRFAQEKALSIEKNLNISHILLIQDNHQYHSHLHIHNGRSTNRDHF